MTTVDEKLESGKTFYESFYDDTSKLFENVFDEEWMNLRAQESVYGNSPTVVNQNTNKSIEEIKKNEADLEKYAAQVKEYTSYAIGRKISKNVPIFSE